MTTSIAARASAGRIVWILAGFVLVCVCAAIAASVLVVKARPDAPRKVLALVAERLRPDAPGDGPSDQRLVASEGALAYPVKKPAGHTPRSWSIPLVVQGDAGFARGGVPFPKAQLFPDEPVALDDGSPIATEVLAQWWDGSVKWLLVESIPRGGNPSLVAGAPAPGPGVEPTALSANDLALNVNGEVLDFSRGKWSVERKTTLSVRRRAEGRLANGVAWYARLERFADGGPERLRLELRNPTPTTSNSGQPTCLTLGCPGTIPLVAVNVRSSSRPLRVRWGEQNGASSIDGGVSLLPSAMELRPGEQYGWEILWGEGSIEPAWLELPAEWACASNALGPLVPQNFDHFADYERNSVVGAEGIRGNRNRSHWRNPRDHGEDQRDWDGGVVEKDFQTHNNEYEVTLTCARQYLRTMGRHACAQDWRYLGLTGARHFANVDIYHVHEGPLPFMHGAAFQHIKHGGSGQGDQHRSSFAPNMHHQTCRGLLAWYYLTGDPLLLESFSEVLENTTWRVMNGPGMPGISLTNEAERAPMNAIGILNDGWAHTNDPRYLQAALKAVEESHARHKTYVTDPSGKWVAKPWMVSMLVVVLDEFQENLVAAGKTAEVAAVKESAGLYKTFLNRVVRPGPDIIHLPYQVASSADQEIDNMRDSWNVVGADALIDYFPDVSKGLFFSGSRIIWYPDHPNGKYAKMLNHVVLSGWGHRTMKALVGAPENEGDAKGSR